MSEIRPVVKEKIKEPLLKAVDCIYIPVADPQKAAEWYETYLGLNRVRPGGDIMLLGNGMWLFLSNSPGQTANFIGGDGAVIAPFTFETDDIVKLHQSLSDSGTPVEPIEDFGGCGLKFWFNDPDGNRFHIWQDPTKTKGNG
ncbi:MAG: VOC family protein [Paenibacillaceae bacterium]|nr:VOC family protein [Paenibacillaceae bacterium]